MKPDTILMIPHLSKELTLIGFPELPYLLQKTGDKKVCNKSNRDTVEVIFNSRRMIEALTSRCFELVKQVKTFGEDDKHFDKLNFEIVKLENQLKLSKSETEKMKNDLANVKRCNQQLQEKVDELQKKLRDYEFQQCTIKKRHQINEDYLKHALKKKESDVYELHKTIWKQFNMANQNYFPENFKLIQLNQPNFNKLWSTVKYSDSITREEALKQAVCIFQKNSKALMEENFSLKTSFLIILKDVNEILKLMVHKLHLPASIQILLEAQDLFENIEEFNVDIYTNCIKKLFDTMKNFCELFEEASFTVSDDLFVCWTHIISTLQLILTEKIESVQNI